MRENAYRTVYKIMLIYPVQTVDLPVGAVVVNVATQNGVPCMWVEVEPAAPSEKRTFAGYGTGHSIEPGYVYVGTAHDVEGMGLVFHIYEKKS